MPARLEPCCFVRGQILFDRLDAGLHQHPSLKLLSVDGRDAAMSKRQVAERIRSQCQHDDDH